MPNMALHVIPLTLLEANQLVGQWHRHHIPAVGHRFSIGCVDDEGVPHGAAIMGRPVARNTNDRAVVEVTRLVTDGTYNACSILYAAAARAAKAMGYQKIQTFILESEPGTSLRASGWRDDGMSGGGSWSIPSRPRIDKHPLEAKQRWALDLNPRTPLVGAFPKAIPDKGMLPLWEDEAI